MATHHEKAEVQESTESTSQIFQYF